MRKLVTVRTVHELQAIEGADNIELAMIDGWQCVVRKGEFKRFDQALFYEVDAFLPCMTDSRYDFLKARAVKWGDKTGVRIKTMKLRGVISQGILLPLSLFPEVVADEGIDIEDMDFSEILGVEKWEPIIHPSLRGTAKGNFPSWIPKTSQERVQNERGLFERYGNDEFQDSTKMDGSSLTAYRYAHIDFEETKQGVCSRNLDLVETEGNLFWKAVHEDKILEKLELLNLNYAIQGELVGSSIQKNFEKLPEGVHQFYVYDIWNIDKQEYLLPKETEQFCKDNDLRHVPINGYFQLNEIAGNVYDLIKRADGKGLYNNLREGIVLKHTTSGYSFKIISNKYLLKNGE